MLLSIQPRRCLLAINDGQRLVSRERAGLPRPEIGRKATASKGQDSFGPRGLAIAYGGRQGGIGVQAGGDARTDGWTGVSGASLVEIFAEKVSSAEVAPRGKGASTAANQTLAIEAIVVDPEGSTSQGDLSAPMPLTIEVRCLGPVTGPANAAENEDERPETPNASALRPTSRATTDWDGPRAGALHGNGLKRVVPYPSAPKKGRPEKAQRIYSLRGRSSPARNLAPKATSVSACSREPAAEERPVFVDGD